MKWMNSWKMDKAFESVASTNYFDRQSLLALLSHSRRPSVYTSISRATFPRLSKIYIIHISLCKTWQLL